MAVPRATARTASAPHPPGLAAGWGAWPGLVLLGLLATGCASLPPPAAPDAATVSAPVEQVCEQCNELRAEIARLRRDLAGRETELRDLRLQHREQARSLEEFARNATRATAKLRRRATRADAASLIADVEVAVAQGRLSPNGKGTSPLVAMAEELLGSASSAFNRGEYGAAFDLADQAWQIATVALEERTSPASPGASHGVVRFERPIPLRVRIDSNLRQQPGMKAAIIGVLREASVVVARARKQSWTRVMAVDGRSGWVYGPLLGPR